MKYLLASVILAFSFLICTSCSTTLTNGKYAEGVVKTRTDNTHHGLIKILYDSDDPEESPLHGVYFYKENDSDYFPYNDTVHFEIKRKGKLVFAHNIANGEVTQGKEKFSSTLDPHDVIDLHIEGISNTDGGAHSKMHIINFMAETIQVNNNNYVKTILKSLMGGSSDSKTVYILEADINLIRSQYDLNNPADVWLSFESFAPTGEKIANASLSHIHTF